VTPAIILDARAIVAGSYRPWQFQSDIASPADWRFAAQCALDGDEDDLRHYLAELAVEIDRQSRFNLPDDDFWKDDLTFERVAVGCVREAA
jgi:hypothetical protein